MRADMPKVIVERPRTGGRQPKGRSQNVPLEDLPQHEGMRKPYMVGGNAKELNENLQPLYRYLESQVGRPWDKIHSDICKHVKLTSAVQRHILEHLKHMVYAQTSLENGTVYIMNGGYSGKQALNEIYGHSVLYVHPATKLLMKRPDRKSPRATYRQKQAAELAARFRDTPGLWQYHKIKGVWYWLKLAKIPKGPMFTDKTLTDDRVLRMATSNGIIVDSYLGHTLYYLDILKKHSQDLLWETYRRHGVYCVARKQCNSRELKKAGLKNDPRPD